MKIIVCGGTRFYGKKLIEKLLEHNHEVVVISRQKITVKEGLTVINEELNIEICTYLKDEKIDFVISNICMNESDAINHVNCFKDMCCKHIIISSIGVYSYEQFNSEGKEEEYNPFDTSDNIGDRYTDKRKMEKILFQELYKDQCFVLRPSVIIGIDDWTKRLDYYIQRLLDSHGIISFEDGHSKFNWTYDWQLAETVVDLVENTNNYKDQIYNVAINDSFTFLEFLKIICQKLHIDEFPFLSLKKFESGAKPYDGYRDPYGKEDTICTVNRLKKVNHSLTDIPLSELNYIITKTLERMEINKVPDYSKRNIEVDFINQHLEDMEIIKVENICLRPTL